jgi:hypothetical protein
MTNSLGALITALLQEKGICSDDYYKISDAVYSSLTEIDLQMNVNDVLELPRGSCLTKTFDPNPCRDIYLEYNRSIHAN